MAYDGEVIIKIDGDDSGFKNKLSGLQKAGKAALGAVSAAAAATGTALAGIGAYAVKVGSDFEAGMSKVQAISGATGDELAQLETKAKEMGATTKFSATESAKALQYMAMAGWKTQQMVDGLPGIMNLAAASGEDLASVSDIVTDALTAFGLQASDSAHFADVLAKASSSSNTNVSMMGATFKYVAPLAGAMGYSIEDTAVAIGLMANAGIKGEQAGTALRAMFTRLSSPPKDAAAAIEALGLKMTDASGKMLPLSNVLDQLRKSFSGLSQEEQVAKASALAGQEAMSGLLAIVNASETDYRKLASAIADADGAAKEQADTMNDNLQGALTLLGSNLEGVGIQIYEGLEEPLKNAVQGVNDNVSTLSRSFSNGQLKSSLNTISKQVGNVITSLSNMAAKAIPKAITAVSNLCQNGDRLATALKALSVAFVALKAASTASAFLKEFHKISLSVTAATAAQTAALTTKELVVGALTGKIGLATAAQTAWNAAMTANPIGTVVMAVGALTAGIALLVAASEDEITETDRLIEKNNELHSQHEQWLNQQEQKTEACEKAIALSNAETNQLEGYIASLKRCADENGKVKDGYQERAAYLTEQINSIIPGAIEMNQEEADSYIKICDNIDLLIAQKRKEAIMNAYQEKYEEALINVTSAQADLIAKEKEKAAAQEKVTKAQDAYNTALQAYQDEYSRCGSIAQATEEKLGNTSRALDDAKAAYEGCAQTASDAREEANRYVDMLNRVNGLELASTQEEINTAIANMNASMVAASNANAAEIKKQYDNMVEARDHAIELLNDPTLPAANRATWEQIARDAQANVETLAQAYENAEAPITDAMQKSINDGAEAVRQATEGSVASIFQEMGAAVADFSDTVVQSTGDNQEALAEAVAYLQVSYDAMVAKAAESWSSMSEEQKNAQLTMLQELKSKLDEQVRVASDGGLKIAEAAGEGAARGAYKYPQEIQSIIDQGEEKLNLAGTKTIGSGENFGKGFDEGLKNTIAEILTTVNNMGTGSTKALSAAIDEHSPARVPRVSGQNFSKGFELGILDGRSGVINAAAKVAQDAVSKAKSTLQIHSPSRVMREQVGRMLPMGMALGIEDGEPAVHAAIMLLSQRAFEVAKEEASDYKNLGTMYMDNLTYGIEAGRDAAISRIVKWIEDDYAAFEKRLDDETDAIVKAKQAQIKKAGEAQKDALQAEIDQIKEDTSAKKKAYKEAGNEVASTYKTALTTGYDEALNAVKKKMTAITEEAQKQRDAVLKDQQAMQDKLAGFGDLFTVSDSGSLSLGNIEQNIKAVERYDAALTALSERGVSDEFMSKVTSLGVEEGTKFAEKLAQLPDSAFEKYMGAWQEQQELAKTVAEKFYADQLQTIDDEFTTKIEDALEDVPNMLDGVGKDSIQGMINGMYSKSGALSAAASEIVRRAISAMQAAADIHSPSGKTRDKIGKPLAEGIAVGFDKQMASVYRRINSTLQGEISRMSEVTKVQAERQAVQSGPAPVQTIYKSTHTDRVTKIGIDERNLSRFGRELLKVIKLEEKRTGPSMMKGGT